MGSQNTPTTTTQIQKTELPAWVDAASQGNYAFAEQVANRPFEQYQGSRVAGLSSGEQAASGILANGMKQADALTGAASGAMARAGAYQPQQVGAGSFLSVNAPNGVQAVSAFNPAATVQGGQGYQAVNAPQGVADVAQSKGATAIGPVRGVADVNSIRFNGADLENYLNPFTNNVVDTTLSGMRDNLALSSQKADDAARSAGAFGSSRSGVMQAVLQSQGAKDMASTEAGLRSAAYTDAAGRLQQDNASALSAALANQQSGLTTQGRQLSADQSNQQSALSTEALNAGIRQGNQQSGLTTQGQRLSAETTNAGNFLSNAGQRLQADLANQGSTNTNNALNAGIAQGNQQSFLTQQAQNLAAQTANQNAYSTASAQNLAAQTANQAAGLSAANLGLQAGTAMGGLANDANSAAGRNALLSSQLGANERGIEQARLDTEAAKWQEAYNAPLEALNTRLAALGMSPYGKTTSTNETKQGGTSSNTGLSVLGGAMSLLPLMFSDRNVKKDVKRKGKIPGTDLNAYEYKYKKGFMGRNMPKQIGLMAQDVEKKVPSAVQTVEVGGKKVKAVDYGAAIAGGRKSRDDKGQKRMGYKPRGFMGRAA